MLESISKNGEEKRKTILELAKSFSFRKKSIYRKEKYFKASNLIKEIRAAGTSRGDFINPEAPSVPPSINPSQI